MRKIAFYLALVFITYTHANEVALKTVTVDGNPAYVLQLGGFAHENNALQLKFKLSSSLNQPITIEHPANQEQYFVNIGPTNDYLLAKELQKKLSNPSKNIVNVQNSSPLTVQGAPKPIEKENENTEITESPPVEQDLGQEIMEFAKCRYTGCYC